jgi:hypothetical protein
MKLTKKWLREKAACDEGLSWFVSQKETDSLKVLKVLMKEHQYQWANWLVCRLMDKPNCVRYAIFAALEVIGIYEKKYPDDTRPRKAIEAAKAWLDDPNDKTKADAAADAAYAAAVDAAYASAADAAYAAAAAAHAAHAAAATAYAAAAYAAYANASRKKLHIKILEYGMKLLKDAEGKTNGGLK